MRIVPFGDDALLADLGPVDATRRLGATRGLATRLAAAFPGTDVVTGAGSVLVAGVAPREEVLRRARLVAETSPDDDAPAVGALHVIETLYDGPDLDEVASTVQLRRDEVVALHTEPDHVVEVVGFLPGFGYLGGVDPVLRLPRRPAPRPAVAAGSVGLAAGFTGVYPFASPGGWHLIGRTSFACFDADAARPARLRVGDRVRFAAVVALAPRARPIVCVDAAAEGPALLVVRAPPLATVQDRGRRGRLAEGLPPSGALDPEGAARANAALGNEPDAAVIEVPLGALEVEATAPIGSSVDGGAPRRLVAGERLVVVPRTAVAYLAVSGGFGVRETLGSRSTLPVAGLGGFAGRALRPGDRVPVGPDSGRRRDRRPAARPSGDEAPCDSSRPTLLRLVPTPGDARLPDAALDELVAATWTVSRLGDRVGVRLEGARVSRASADLGLPMPMVRGAVEITTDGTPIVLGPDHPTTGGYPVVGVLTTGAQSALARLSPGAPVRFVVA